MFRRLRVLLAAAVFFSSCKSVQSGSAAKDLTDQEAEDFCNHELPGAQQAQIDQCKNDPLVRQMDNDPKKLTVVPDDVAKAEQARQSKEGANLAGYGGRSGSPGNDAFTIRPYNSCDEAWHKVSTACTFALIPIIGWVVGGIMCDGNRNMVCGGYCRVDAVCRDKAADYCTNRKNSKMLASYPCPTGGRHNDLDVPAEPQD